MNSLGMKISLTLFGESHGQVIGGVLSGMTPGLLVDMEEIKKELRFRHPKDEYSTPRQDSDDFQIVSGLKDGVTTGAPIAVTITQKDIMEETQDTTSRPSHGDYTTSVKFFGYEEHRGGGHNSGRLTAPLVILGSICKQALKKKGVVIGSHILNIGEVYDRAFSKDLQKDVEILNNKDFPVLSEHTQNEMQEAIKRASQEKDSLGGSLETVVLGVEGGLGGLWFDSLEGELSKAIFGIPGVKGLTFGAGEKFARGKGSEYNDEIYVENGIVKTTTNYSGGINAGISNGMPIQFKTVFRPTPTIGKEQKTIDYLTKEETITTGTKRNDPTIVRRARSAVEAVVAIILCDEYAKRKGDSWFLM